jgi:hypothetical protein
MLTQAAVDDRGSAAVETAHEHKPLADPVNVFETQPSFAPILTPISIEVASWLAAAAVGSA